MKNAWPNLQKVNLHYSTRKKVFYEHGPSEAWFSSYGLLEIKENAQSVHLELQCRMLQV
jgi:hypothetical protein